MTTTKHQRSTHIDAPVETVFDYVEDPHHFFAGDGSHDGRPLAPHQRDRDATGAWVRPTSGPTACSSSPSTA